MADLTIDELIRCISKNVFDPSDSSSTKPPDEPGSYIICLKNGIIPEIEFKSLDSKLFGELKFDYINDHRVLYAGIAGVTKTKRNSLQKREDDHFKNNISHKSTLRRSLGVLRGYKLNICNNFTYDEEYELTKWMRKSLIVYYYKHDNPNISEGDLIKKLYPPLNLSKTKDIINNSNFRLKLKTLRKKTSKIT